MKRRNDRREGKEGRGEMRKGRRGEEKKNRRLRRKKIAVWKDWILLEYK